MATRLERFDIWEGPAQGVINMVPYLALTVSVVLTLLATGPGWPDVRITFGVAGAAYMWVLFAFTLGRGWERNPVMRVVSYAGLLVFAGALVYLSPWFGFFTFACYLYVDRFPGRWWVVGVVASALIAATSQVGGVYTLRTLTPTVIALYATAILFNLGAAGGMVYISWLGGKRREDRERMVAELTDANRRLEEAMEENAGLHAQLLVQAREAGITDERQRMAREIHDTLAQGLAGILTQVQAAQRSADRPEDLRRRLDTTARLARQSLSEARRTVHAIRPEALEKARLPDALGDVAGQWSAISGVPAEVTTTGDPRPLHPAVETALLRTTQEALANVAKHASASRVGLTLSYMEDVVMLDVRDDGVGFDPEGVPACDGADSGYGLTAMRQRMRRLTGRLDVESEPGAGTAISASVPAVPVGGAA